jgi:Fur family transcriptional regulator, ferric uptake regulator
MTPKPRPLRDDDLRQFLVERGIRVTGQRLVILRELARARVPVSHAELTECLAGPTLDRATIYRNLIGLHDAGVLVRTQLGDNIWRYELPRSKSADHGTHPHFVCIDCGDVACLPESAVAIRGQFAGKRVTEVQLRGHCLECQGA